jgi:hypothetical protein
MLHTQRTTSLLESSAKDTSSHIDGISLEVRQSVSMLSDALVELQQSLPATGIWSSNGRFSQKSSKAFCRVDYSSF